MLVRDRRLLGLLLAARGESMRQLAVRAGVSHSNLSLLASGARTSCSAEMAERICDALGVEVPLLFEPRPRKPSRKCPTLPSDSIAPEQDSATARKKAS